MNILYVTLKHAIQRFRICNYFHQIFKFRDFMNALMIFAKYIIVHMFIISKTLKFFQTAENGRNCGHFVKIAHKLIKAPSPPLPCSMQKCVLNDLRFINSICAGNFIKHVTEPIAYLNKNNQENLQKLSVTRLLVIYISPISCKIFNNILVTEIQNRFEQNSQCDF